MKGDVADDITERIHFYTFNVMSIRKLVRKRRTPSLNMIGTAGMCAELLITWFFFRQMCEIFIFIKVKGTRKNPWTSGTIFILKRIGKVLQNSLVDEMKTKAILKIAILKIFPNFFCTSKPRTKSMFVLLAKKLLWFNITLSLMAALYSSQFLYTGPFFVMQQYYLTSYLLLT